MFLFELALEMGMPVSEMVSRMSAHELCVEWPIYLDARETLRKRLEDLEGTVPPEQFDREYTRTMGG